MKKTLLVVTMFLLAFAMSANGQLLLSENFDYSGQLSANGWSIHSGTTNFISTTAGLTYSGYVNSEIGDAAFVSNLGGEDVNIGLSDSVYTNNQSVYVSFLINVNDVAASKTGDYSIHFGNRATPTSFISFCARVFIRIVSSNVNFGLSNLSIATSVKYSPTNFSKNTTYLAILKYTVNTGGVDTTKLWIVSSGVPADEISAGAPTVFADSANQLGQDIVDAIALRQGSSSTSVGFVVDGIRVAKTWSSAPLPVELTSFIGTVKGTGVELAWKTATEINNHGFEIERRASGGLHLEGGAHLAWTKIGFVEGHGTTNAPQSYTFVDGNASGAVAYRLKQIDRDGSFEYSNQVEVTVAAPVEFALMQNHPNPFNPATSINYTLPVAGHVSLKIYDMLGKEVATLVNGMQDAGAKIAQFNASQLPSGIYFYTLRTNTFNATKKMLLVK